jgi:hypothetical protein
VDALQLRKLAKLLPSGNPNIVNPNDLLEHMEHLGNCAHLRDTQGSRPPVELREVLLLSCVVEVVECSLNDDGVLLNVVPHLPRLC